MINQNSSHILFGFILVLQVLSICFANVNVTDVVGDNVCFEGYIMDVFCIDRGTLLDKPSVVTLQNPEQHSVHCLVDVGSCIQSGYEILMDPEMSGVEMYSRAYRLDDNGNTKILETAREVGICSTCTGNGSLRQGYRATITGTILEPSTADNPALVSVENVLSSSEGCSNFGGIRMPSKIITTATSGDSFTTTARWHGSLMVIGWGVMIPSGVIIAKLGRRRLGSWFHIHIALQSFGLLITLISWIIALKNFDVFSPPHDAKFYAHGVIGSLTMAMGLVQPLNALVRPHAPEDGSKKSIARFAWEVIHKSFGYIAIVLAVVTIGLGTTLLPNVDDQLKFQLVYGIGGGIFLLGLIVFLFYDKGIYSTQKKVILDEAHISQ